MKKVHALEIKMLTNEAKKEREEQKVAEKKKLIKEEREAKERIRPAAKKYFNDVLKLEIKKSAEKGEQSLDFSEDDYHEIPEWCSEVKDRDELDIFFKLVIEILKKEGFKAEGGWHSYKSTDASGYGSDWHSYYQITIQW